MVEKPSFLTKEDMERRYGVDTAMEHYKKMVYPGQREGWYYGRTTNNYRQNYEKIKWRKS
uniref:Uncharacterized protein n=1 Tax=viral metagenome TaxID=1070528 RepID=A0A6M3ILQ0_9ZZZZ